MSIRVTRLLFIPASAIALFTMPRPADAEETAAEPTSTGDTSDIVGGSAVGVCDWPSTVFLGNCSGTLIHPRVVVTAAHCSPKNGAKINFGEKTPWAFTISATKCVTSGMPGGPKDWAYCILPDDPRLQQVPILPPINGCEKDKFLKPGATLMAVGFGATSAAGSGVGTKRQVQVKVTAVGNGTVDVDGDSMHGLCHGDSGGPIFIHLVDGANDYGWRAVGSTTGLVGPGGECAAGTRFMSLDQHIAAIEKNEGIDVTPCTDSTTGAWDPSPDCHDFPTDPANGGGMWPMCSPGPLSGPIASCGPSVGTGGAGGGPSVDAGTDSGSGMRDASTDREAGGRSGSTGSGGGGSGGANRDGGGGPGGDGGSGVAGSAGSSATAGSGGQTTGQGGDGAGGSGRAGSAGATGTGVGPTGAGGVTVGTGGNGGSSGGSGGRPSSGSSGGDGNDGNGCACRAGGARSSSAGWLTAVALGLFASARRRRSRR